MEAVEDIEVGAEAVADDDGFVEAVAEASPGI